jgi:hypothetical protein
MNFLNMNFLSHEFASVIFRPLVKSMIYHNKKNRGNRGFIALISILIFSVVLLVTVLSLSYKGLSSRLLLVDFERKTQSEKFAEGCIATGIIAVINDPLYAVTDKVVDVGSGECTLTITPNSPSSGQSELEAHATSLTGNATTNYRVVINSSSAAFVSWQELPTL